MDNIDTGLFVTTAHSEDPETEFAIEDILDNCRSALKGRTPKAAILYAGIDMDHQLILDSINNEWPGITLIGCSSDGEISSSLGFSESSITLILFDSDVIEFTAGVGRNIMQDMGGACRNAVSEARSGSAKKPALCITSPDGLLISGQMLIQTLKNELGEGIPVFGGAATDQWRFKMTYQFFGNEILANSVPIMLFSGPLTFSYGVASGCKPIGRDGTVTRSGNKIVYEIDSKPAIRFYRSIMGNNVMPSPEYPLAILDSDGNPQYQRTAVGLPDPATGKVEIYSDIAEGSQIRIAVADRESLLEGSRNSVTSALQKFPNDKKIKAAFFFTCSARKYLLGTRTKEEIEIARSVLPGKTEIFGFYGYGEIAPLENNIEDIKFYDETFVTLLLG